MCQRIPKLHCRAFHLVAWHFSHKTNSNGMYACLALVLLCIALLIVEGLDTEGLESNESTVVDTTKSWRDFLDCYESLNRPNELYNCIQLAANNHNQLIRHSYAYQMHPRPLFIGLVSYITKDIIPYSCFSLAISLAFAIHNRYLLFILDDNSIIDNMDRYDVRWNKVNALIQGVADSGFAWDVDYLLWIDADLTFLDLDYSIQSLVVSHSDAQIIVSSEHAGSSTLINSGSILCRVSKYTMDFLQQWYSTPAHRRYFSDQEAFDILYTQRVQSEQRKPESAASQEYTPVTSSITSSIVILPPHVLNTLPPAMTQLRPDHHVLHLMGEEERFRSAAFSMAYRDVVHCLRQALTRDNQSIDEEMYTAYERRLTAESTAMPLHHPQMTLDQPALLYLTLEVYFKLAYDMLELVEEQVNTKQLYVDLSQCRKLANVVHHYVHALEHVLTHGLLVSSSRANPVVDARIRQLVCQQLFDGVVVDNNEYLMRFVEQTARTLRVRVYNLLKENLLHIKASFKGHFVFVPSPTRPGDGAVTIHHDNIAVLVDYPELVKQVAIAGQHLLLPANHAHAHTMSVDAYSQSVSDIGAGLANKSVSADASSLTHKVFEELHVLIEEMLRTTHATQHPAIHAMQAHIYHQQGLHAVHEGLVEYALVQIESYYNISYALSLKSGEYGMIIPSLLYANVLSLNKLYSVAEKLYVKGIDIARRYQPTYQQEYLQLLCNYGIALYAQQKSTQAVDIFTAAINFCFDDAGAICKLIADYLRKLKGL